MFFFFGSVSLISLSWSSSFEGVCPQSVPTWMLASESSLVKRSARVATWKLLEGTSRWTFSLICWCGRTLLFDDKHMDWEPGLAEELLMGWTGSWVAPGSSIFTIPSDSAWSPGTDDGGLNSGRRQLLSSSPPLLSNGVLFSACKTNLASFITFWLFVCWQSLAFSTLCFCRSDRNWGRSTIISIFLDASLTLEESIVLTSLILLKMELFNIIFTAMTIIILNKIVGHSEDSFNKMIPDHYDDNDDEDDDDDR